MSEAWPHGVVPNSRRAEDRFSTPTSLVLTFCRNNVTVEVEDVRKGGRRKSTGGKRNRDSRSAKHRGERGVRVKIKIRQRLLLQTQIFLFFTLSYSKWWIKQTETAACVQPNPWPSEVGPVRQAPPLRVPQRRSAAPLCPHWLIWTTNCLSIGHLSCRSEHFYHKVTRLREQARLR